MRYFNHVKKIIRCFLLGFLIGNLFQPFIPSLVHSQTSDTSSSNQPSPQPSAVPDPSLAGVGTGNGDGEKSLEESIEKSRFIRYERDRWNEMRRRLEAGEVLIPKEEKPLVPEEKLPPKKPLAPPPPVGPGINVVLPYESGLSISGRKLIDFNLTSTIFDEPDLGKGRVNKSDFTLKQELQVRVKGTVGRKVTVNVDFDDTRENKRDISVVYKGDPDEVLQEAAFGDITISLPSTEFVGYSKAVFGAKAQLQFRPRTGFAALFPDALWPRHTPKQIKMYFIGSRTKGITQTKRFTGQSILQRKELNDINYARRQFYMLAFSTGAVLEDRPIQVGSERIFVDDQNPNNNNADESTRTFKVVDSAYAVDGITVTTATFLGPSQSTNTGVFKLLVPGVDYNVDYRKGVVRFKRTIQKTDVLAADYIPVGETLPVSQLPSRGGGTPLDPKVTDPAKDTILKGYMPFLLKPDESQFFGTRELKNYYDLGDKNIVRDDGRGNFILKITDLNRNDVASLTGLEASTNVIVQTKSASTYPNQIDMDFDNGILSFVSTDSLRSPNPRPFTDDIYIFRDDVPSFKNRYRIFAEYRFRKGNYNLEQTNIVPQSEIVFVDGRKTTRDVDYYIDYDLGIVTFFHPEVIRNDSIIEITYDFSPFGGQGEETLVGLRTEFYFTDNMFLGNSVLFNFAPTQRGLPDIRSTSRSITVLEADFNWKNIKFGNFPVQISNLAGEVARSIKNPNTADKALIESFEGIKIEDTANLNKQSWQVASTPEKGNPDASSGAFEKMYASALTLSNEDANITDVNPAAQIPSGNRFQTLLLNYDFQTGTNNEAASVVQVLNRSGVDFFTNTRQFVEMWIYGDNSKNQLLLRFGGIDENSDKSNFLKTEDTNHDGVLSPGEDIGWQFLNPNLSSATIGAGNGFLDSQDLNRNGILDGDDRLGNYLNEIGTSTNPLVESNGTKHSSIDWTGWKIFQIPLSIAATAQLEWSSIKNVRVSLVRSSIANSKAGTIRIGRISAVGTRFQPAQIEPSTGPVIASIFAQNNQDNPDYPSLVSNSVYQELYDLQDTRAQKREQALAIQFQQSSTITANVPQISTVTTKETFSSPIDLSEHRKFNFFLYGDVNAGSNSQFFIRIGNPGNYFEYTTALNVGTWQRIQLDIEDKNRDGLPDAGIALGDSGKFQRIAGAPSLRNISEITMGVYVNKADPPDSVPRKIYVNEIHVTGATKLVGDAYRVNTDFAWTGWGSWGGRWRFKDRNFQTLTSLSSGQDEKGGSAYLNVNRLRFLPVNTNMNYSEVVTPQIQTVNDPNILISKLDEGRTINTSQNLSGNFLMTQLPLIPGYVRNKLLNVDFSADHSLALRSQSDREDETFNYRYGSSYTLPWRPDVLPTRYLTFQPLPTSIGYSFSQNRSITKILGFGGTETASIANSYSMRTAFQFFPQLSLNPSYSLSETFEERAPIPSTGPIPQSVLDSLGKYNKGLNQNVALGGSLRITSWLTPAFNYSITTAETYNVSPVIFGSTSTFQPGRLKSITRKSDAGISATFAPKDVFQYIPLVRSVNPFINSLSFSGGYTIADGDTYENMGAGFYSKDKLIIRGKLLDTSDVGNDHARRTNLTATDSTRLSGRWTPFEGFTFMRGRWNRFWAPIRNVSTSGNFTETKGRQDNTGTESFSYSRVWPDFILSTSELEKPFFLNRWMTDTRANATYQERLTEQLGQTRTTGLTMNSDFTFTLFKLLQFSVGYNNTVSQDENLQTNQVTSRTRSQGINGQVITTLKFGNWRFTPRYDQSQTESEDGTGKKTADLVNRNAALQIFGDINIPRFFRLPFGKQLKLSNRLILTSSIRWSMVRNGVDDTQSKDTINSDLNGDFEITPNIRAAFGGGFGRTIFKTKREENSTTISFNTRITIQF